MSQISNLNIYLKGLTKIHVSPAQQELRRQRGRLNDALVSSGGLEVPELTGGIILM